jgi:hypothetical protein
LSSTLQKKMAGIISSAVTQTRDLNAETVTAIATGFLKRIGHKSGLKPKRVTLEEETYTVEVEMKKLSALVRVDSKTHEIKEYEIQAKGEETPTLLVSPKSLLVVFAVSAAVFVAFYFLFKNLGI